MLPFSLSDIPLISRYIGVLVVLEGLLSADNALVLALMVRHLPRSEQKRVLRIGIWGAIGFRFIAVLLSAVLIKFWIFKVLGGGYLLYLAIKHFAGGESGQESGPRGWQSTFWGTVAAVTFADIAFSIDSIVAAVGMAEDFPAQFGDKGKVFIVFVGGVLGIITMRFVVRYFILLLDKFPGLAQGAYVLVAWIGLKLMINGLHSATPTYHRLPHAGMAVLVGHARDRRAQLPDPAEDEAARDGRGARAARGGGVDYRGRTQKWGGDGRSLETRGSGAPRSARPIYGRVRVRRGE